MNSLKRVVKGIIPERFRPWIKLYALRFIHYGKHYYCPVCNSHTRHQKTLGFDFPVIVEKNIVGAGVRAALCPVCHSSDRIRLLYLFLRQKTNFFKDPLSLLHFAPEPSLQLIIEGQKNIQYLTADLYQENVMEKIDITSIPYPDHSFDVILCNHVLEHIPDDRKAMKELYRVLKPGGWAILQVPVSNTLETTFEDPGITSENDRERVFGQRDHVRIYGKDYVDRLNQTGFMVEEFSWVNDPDNSFHDPRINLNKEEVVYYCQR